VTDELPTALRCFFAGKNARDFDTAILAFSEASIVKDEGQTLEGHAAIRAWMEETSRKYNDTAEVREIATKGDAVEVAALVSGTFPGSPATLRFMFTLDSDRIARLEITA